MMNNGLKIYVTVHTSLSKINTPYYEIIHCCYTFLIFRLSSVGWFNKNVREKNYENMNMNLYKKHESE